MSILQDKMAQHDMDAEKLAQVELQNWGTMLRCQSSPFPRGFTPDPMFRDIVSRYRDSTPIRETFSEDRAVATLELVNFLITDERQKLAIYYYYAEKHTNGSISEAMKEFNKTIEKNGHTTIGESSFRALLKKVEIQIGSLAS